MRATETSDSSSFLPVQCQLVSLRQLGLQPYQSVCHPLPVFYGVNHLQPTKPMRCCLSYSDNSSFILQIYWNSFSFLCFLCLLLYNVFSLAYVCIEVCIFNVLCFIILGQYTCLLQPCCCYWCPICGVTKVGVTRCGNWWCHPIFFPQKVMTFFPSNRLSSVLCKFSRKEIRLSLGCHRVTPPPPPHGATRGRTHPPSDATVSNRTRQRVTTLNCRLNS